MFRKVLCAVDFSATNQTRIEHTELEGRKDVRLLAREGAPPSTIVALAEEAQADLVVIASSGRGMASALLGVTDRVVRMSHVPVLVLPRSTVGSVGLPNDVFVE